MNQTIKRKWVRALRSKKFKQGRRLLKYTTQRGAVRHCCLGVLCELFNKERKQGAKERKVVANSDELSPDARVAATRLRVGGKAVTVHVFRDEAEIPPRAVLRWAGLSAGYFDNDYAELAEMNDQGKSFATIAAHIEKNM